MHIMQIAESVSEEVVFLRRELHKIAELSFEEYKTAAFIAAYLEKLGIPCRTGVAKTGVVAYLDAGKKHTLLLRADMDALPVEETNDVPYQSQTEGVMHACGHDAHMAVALATAKCMASRKDLLQANVLFVFQPGEETTGGAEPMIATGILEEFGVTCATGLHVMNDVEAGKIRVKSGPLMAAPDDFDLTIKGKGGHGAYPKECNNPIPLAANIICAFDEIGRKLASAQEPAVLSTCMVQGGDANNIIPDTVYVSGTVRTFDSVLRKQIPVEMEQSVKRICDLAGADYDFQFHFRYPPLINHDTMAEILATSAAQTLGSEHVIIGGEPSMAGEDFAYFSEKVPSVFFYLGSGNKKSGIDMPLHSTNFKIDESCLTVGVATYLSLVFNDCIYFE